MYGDALGYYIYLPAYFIHDKLSEVDRLADDKRIDSAVRSGIDSYKNNYSQNDKGNTIIQYTCGLALVQSPAFLVVHLYDKMRGESATGFELRYQNALYFVNMFSLLLGLFFGYKCLRFFFSPLVCILSTAILLLGSNLLWFGFLQVGMAHVPQHMLIAGLLLISLKNREEWKDRNILLMSFVLGLITIIRPTDIIMGVIPLTMIVSRSISDIHYREVVLQSVLRLLIPSAIIFLIPILPQLCYWKMMTGDFVFDSYSNYGFNWAEPQIVAGLFGAKNGWFAYTPLMLLATLPFVTQRVDRDMRWVFLLIVPIYIYITYAWFNYYYINGFGSRPMIHLYPIMVFGIAGLLSYRKWWLRILIGSLLIFSVSVNLLFTHKQHNGRLHSDESTYAFNKATIFKKHLDYEDLFLMNSPLEQPSTEVRKFCATVQSLDIQYMQNDAALYDSLQKKKYLQNKSDSTFPYGSVQHILDAREIRSHKTMKVSAEMRFGKHVFMQHDQHKMVIEIYANGVQKYWESITINDKIGKKDIDGRDRQIRSTIIDTWDRVDFHIPMDIFEVGDRVKAYIWNTGQQSGDLADLEISLCK